MRNISCSAFLPRDKVWNDEISTARGMRQISDIIVYTSKVSRETVYVQLKYFDTSKCTI